MRRTTVPLLAPDTTFTDPKVEEAVKWVLGKEKLELAQLKIEEAPRLLYFKHEERPLVVNPQKLVVGKPRPDELNRGSLKVNIAFTLPPGSYATLVVKRLFHFGVKKEEPDDVRPAPYETEEEKAERAIRRPAADHKSGKPERPTTPEVRDLGFLARQRDKKTTKHQNRMRNVK
jgi:tRNA pseudouridine13 synthase